MSRGKRKPKLRDLSVNPLTLQEQDLLIDTIRATQTAIAAAILGAVLIEHELDTSLRKQLKITDDIAWQKMVDEGGPLSTFARKIMIGRALRLYDASFEVNLNVIRNVRNAFAHSKRVIDFKHPLVAAQLKRVNPVKPKKLFRLLISEPSREGYICLCMGMTTQLMAKRTKNLIRATKRRGGKIPTSDFYRALAPFLGIGLPLPVLQGSNPLSSPPNQTAYPIPEAQRRLTGGIFGINPPGLIDKNNK